MTHGQGHWCRDGLWAHRGKGEWAGMGRTKEGSSDNLNGINKSINSFKSLKKMTKTKKNNF